MAVAQGPSVSVLQAWASLHSPQGRRGQGVLALTKPSYGLSMWAASSARPKRSNEAVIQRIGAKPDLPRSLSKRKEAIS